MLLRQLEKSSGIKSWKYHEINVENWHLLLFTFTSQLRHLKMYACNLYYMFPLPNHAIFVLLVKSRDWIFSLELTMINLLRAIPLCYDQKLGFLFVDPTYYL